MLPTKNILCMCCCLCIKKKKWTVHWIMGVLTPYTVTLRSLLVSCQASKNPYLSSGQGLSLSKAFPLFYFYMNFRL